MKILSVKKMTEIKEKFDSLNKIVWDWIYNHKQEKDIIYLILRVKLDDVQDLINELKEIIGVKN